jgi:hypothetical protein
MIEKKRTHLVGPSLSFILKEVLKTRIGPMFLQKYKQILVLVYSWE